VLNTPIMALLITYLGEKSLIVEEHCPMLCALRKMSFDTKSHPQSCDFRIIVKAGPVYLSGCWSCAHLKWNGSSNPLRRSSSWEDKIVGGGLKS
jgi:hypothetical protein